MAKIKIKEVVDKKKDMPCGSNISCLDCINYIIDEI